MRPEGSTSITSPGLSTRASEVFSPRLERPPRVMAHECAYDRPRRLFAVMGGEHRLKPEPLRGASSPHKG